MLLHSKVFTRLQLMNMQHKYMNKIFKIAVLFLGGLFLLSACGGDKVSIRTDYKKFDYDSIKTYRWHDDAAFDAKSPISQITYDFIKKTIDKELAAKSLEKQIDGVVDFYVNFSVTSETRVDIRDYKVYAGESPGFTWYRESGFESGYTKELKTDYNFYREGSLVVDIVDPATNKLIWRGVASKRITKELKQAQREKVIAQAVNRMLANFPPKEK